MELPDFEHVTRARDVVRQHLPATPAYEYPALSASLGKMPLGSNERGPLK